METTYDKRVSCNKTNRTQLGSRRVYDLGMGHGEELLTVDGVRGLKVSQFGLGCLSGGSSSQAQIIHFLRTKRDVNEAISRVRLGQVPQVKRRCHAKKGKPHSGDG